MTPNSAVVLRGHDKAIMTATISADNRWLVSGSDDQTARIWMINIEDLIDKAELIVGRNFYQDEWDMYFPGEAYRKTFSDLP